MPPEARDFSFLINVQTGYGPIQTHLHPVTKIRMGRAWSYTHAPRIRLHGMHKEIFILFTLNSITRELGSKWVSPFFQAMKALRESRGIALLCF
jgi:hypothetical protein